jgi:hypothetical protein
VASVKREAYELLLIETRYGQIEPWAWARLSQRLRVIKTRRAKLRPAAA